MGIIYAKKQTFYNGIDAVSTYNDSIIIRAYGRYFKVLKSNENLQNIANIISHYKGTGRVCKFTYDTTMFSNVLIDISVICELQQNMKFTKKIDYVCNKNFDEFVSDSPIIFIISKNISNDLILGSTYKIKYLFYMRFNLITSYIQVGLGNEMVDIVEHSIELDYNCFHNK